MTEKYLYQSLLDNRINDGVRAYCRAEGLDERYFRRCVSRRNAFADLLRTMRRKLRRSQHRKSDLFVSDVGLPR